MRLESLDVLNTIKEGGQRVFSPNNKPTAADVGALSVTAKAVDSDKLDGINSSQFVRGDYLIGRKITDANNADSTGAVFNFIKGANQPTGTDHALLSMSYSKGWSVQMAGDWRTNRWYIRNQNQSKWGSWAELYSTVNKPTAADVGAITKAQGDGYYLGKTAKAVSAVVSDTVGKTNLGKTRSAYLNVVSNNWWGDTGIGTSQMLKSTSKGVPNSSNGYAFKIGARDTAKGHSWLFTDDYNGGGNLYFGTSAVGTSAPKWFKVFSTNNKPTAADVGVRTDLQNDGRYIQPNSTPTFGNKVDISAGGDNIDASLELTESNKQHGFRLLYKGASDNTVALQGKQSGRYLDMMTFSRSGGTVNFPEGVLDRGQRPYSYLNKPTAADVGALPSDGKAVNADKLDGLDSSQFRRKINLAGIRDFGQAVLLLHRLDGKGDANYFFDGEVYIRRTNGLYEADPKVRITSHKGYSPSSAILPPRGSVIFQGSHSSNLTTVTCVYQGHTYLALKLAQSQAQAGIIEVSGKWSSEPVVVEYNYAQPGNESVTNSEIKNSIQEVVLHGNTWTGGGLYEGYNRVYSAANKPTPADIGVLAADGTAKNSEKLQGFVSAQGGVASTIARRDGNGDISARLFRSNYQPTESTAPPRGASVCFRNTSDAGDNYMRFMNKSAMVDWLGTYTKADIDAKINIKKGTDPQMTVTRGTYSFASGGFSGLTVVDPASKAIFKTKIKSGVKIYIEANGQIFSFTPDFVNTRAYTASQGRPSSAITTITATTSAPIHVYLVSPTKASLTVEGFEVVSKEDLKSALQAVVSGDNAAIKAIISKL